MVSRAGSVGIVRTMETRVSRESEDFVRVARQRPARLAIGQSTQAAKKTMEKTVAMSGHLPGQNSRSCFGRRPCRGGRASVSFVLVLVDRGEQIRAKLVAEAKLLLFGDGLVVRPLRDCRARNAQKARQLGLAHRKSVEQFGLGHTSA